MSGPSSLWLVLIVLLGIKVASLPNDGITYNKDHLKDTTCEKDNPGKTCVELDLDDFETYFVSLFASHSHRWILVSTFSVNGSAEEFFAEDTADKTNIESYYKGVYLPIHENRPYFYHMEYAPDGSYEESSVYTFDGSRTWSYKINTGCCS
ncbi:unnamed protein product [Bursaphelenchus okinawaensis]|uniref:Uncharacterized protein n=1 Tax=Bursaphelenchus okinawaensis TaxID=465554 RepID=A0A811KC89_9BILA|nr:unnamed protein product [Bursaphelenchus okinawaensis]CAG9098476.1 unnamed protein product [Bursaphelenchus okinawaensis]